MQQQQHVRFESLSAHDCIVRIDANVDHQSQSLPAILGVFARNVEMLESLVGLTGVALEQTAAIVQARLSCNTTTIKFRAIAMYEEVQMRDES